LSEIGNEGTVRLWRGGEAEAKEHHLSLPALVRAGVCSDQEAQHIGQALIDPSFTFVRHTVFAAWGRRTGLGEDMARRSHLPDEAIACLRGR
jgi:hypothetical protein